MVKVILARVGGDPHTFEFEDILRGAVRESGLFPELYERLWPAITSGVLVTGVERKLDEHRSTLEAAGLCFNLHTPRELFPRALEDSKEQEVTSADIAATKIYKSFLNPLRGHVATLSKPEKKGFLQDFAHRAGVDHVGKLIAIGDDRSRNVDPAYLQLLYGSLRNHWNPQVREIFTPGHDVPGKRVKETDSALYGVSNSNYCRQVITEGLRNQQVDIDSTFVLNTTLCFIPCIAGALPFPEEGIVISAEGDRTSNKPFTQEDFAKIDKGRIFTYDNFTLADYPDLPSGTTIADLKEMPSGALHPLLTQESSHARAMRVFAEIVKLPKKSEYSQKQRFVPLASTKPQTVASSVSLVTAAPPMDDSLPLPKGMALSTYQGPLKHLYDLEVFAHSGQAFVIQNPDTLSVARTSDLNEISEEDIFLLRRLETDLIYAYLITMSTQAGAPNHTGRPHLVEKSFYRQYGRWHADFANMGLAGDIETEAYRIYENAEELQANLGLWDKSTYQHTVPQPPQDYVDEDFIKRSLKREDLGFVVSGYGSASSFLDAAYRDAFDTFYALSRRGVMTVDGGGVRSAMLGMREAILKAHEDGYDVLNLGIRSETDVSPLEGNIEDWIRDRGFEPKEGENDRHISFADGHMHILKMDRLLQRQAPIAALADASVFFAGGKGTMVEKCIARLHNARVRIFGHGLYPGFSSNTRFSPIIDVDHEFKYLGGLRKVWDVVNEPYKDRLEWLGQYSFSGPDRIQEATQFVTDYAEGRLHIDGQTHDMAFDLSLKKSAKAALSFLPDSTALH